MLFLGFIQFWLNFSTITQKIYLLNIFVDSLTPRPPLIYESGEKKRIWALSGTVKIITSTYLHFRNRAWI